MLHITNGDSAATLLRQAALPGEVLAWKDVLHEGPVPAGLSPAQLRRVRARFIAARGWAPEGEVLADLERRDMVVDRAGKNEEVVLWFEHDLYDQLQLLQVLDRFATKNGNVPALSLIVIDAFPGVEPFYGLGQLTPVQLSSLFWPRPAVTTSQLQLARAAWAAFQAPEPADLERLRTDDTSSLPFLAGALRRHQQQYPSVRDGLSRTERQILEAVAAGATSPLALFRADQARETAPFMGDTVLWSYLADLASPPYAVLDLSAPRAIPGTEEFDRQTVGLTATGQDVLAGLVDRIHLAGLDRWLGGVHLEGRQDVWRWDGQRLTGEAIAGDRVIGDPADDSHG